MHFTTAKELRIKTGEILKRISRGERYIVTYRGKPIAIMLPFDDKRVAEEIVPRSYEKAWKDIEKALLSSPARQQSWQEAIEESRRRQ